MKVEITRAGTALMDIAVAAMVGFAVGVVVLVIGGCSTTGGTSSTAAEVADIQGIQVAGDAAAAGAILYAGFTGNTNLAAQVASDQQNFDALCASGVAAVQAGTNAGFAAIEANLAALAASIEKSFSTPAPASSAPAPAVVAKAVASSRASMASAGAKTAAAKAKYAKR
jgi:hypothetical protein